MKCHFLFFLVYFAILYGRIRKSGAMKLDSINYRNAIVEIKDEDTGGLNKEKMINFSSDKSFPIDGTTYKKAIILGAANEVQKKKKSNNRFSFKETSSSYENSEIVEAFIKENMNPKQKVENEFVNNLGEMVKDVIHSVYSNEKAEKSQGKDILNKTFENYKNKFMIIMNEMLKVNVPPSKETNTTTPLPQNTTKKDGAESKKNERGKEINKSPGKIEEKKKTETKPLPNIIDPEDFDADDSSIISELLHKYKA